MFLGAVIAAAGAACTASPRGTVTAQIVVGDDWSLPAWVQPAPSSGFFSEDAQPSNGIETRSVDVTWGQLAPEPRSLVTSGPDGSAQGMRFTNLDDQLARDAPYWMRIFASGVDWAPPWVAETCEVAGIGPDYDGELHLPIWNPCVWSALADTYRALFSAAGRNLAADPSLRFVYVPGAFTWVEYDYDTISQAVDQGELDWPTYEAWYDQMIGDLVGIFGEYRWKLVFTGEDYPFGPFGADDDLLAKRAVDAGMGLRTGITEVSNFHLSDAPAYGSRIQPNGHLRVNRTADPRAVFATENECYTNCGFTTDDAYYAVRQSNLKALQLQMNWMYVVVGDSKLDDFPEHWAWVRRSLGHTVATAADAWVALRDAEDTYWNDDEAITWPTKPWVRNLERFMTQVDDAGCVAHRSDADVHTGVFAPENGSAHEGLSTAIASGDTGLCFQLDPGFVVDDGAAEVKVTYLDAGTGAFTVVFGGVTSPAIERSDDGNWKTATVEMPAAPSDGRFRISLSTGAEDVTIRFVRVIRSTEPRRREPA